MIWGVSFEGFVAAMSKVSFRARALDATKPLPIYHAEDIPDLTDFSVINRTVPQMPTGMEKEEETVREVVRDRMQIIVAVRPPF